MYLTSNEDDDMFTVEIRGAVTICGGCRFDSHYYSISGGRGVPRYCPDPAHKVPCPECGHVAGHRLQWRHLDRFVEVTCRNGHRWATEKITEERMRAVWGQMNRKAS